MMCNFQTLLLAALTATTVTPSHALVLHNPHDGQAQQRPIRAYDHSQGYAFDPLLHLPGISPYFDAVGFGLRHSPPQGCNVTAATYVIRHTAIYANEGEYDEYIKPFLLRLEQHRGHFSGPLAFLNKWQSPILEDKLEDITPRGAEDATTVGKHLLKHYPHLIPTTKKILADKKSRTYDTAKAFVKAFPQGDDIQVVRFKRPKDGSMNPIIPHKSCRNFTKEPGTDEMAEFVHVYASRVSERLSPYTPFRLADKDVVAMQSTCGYETAITDETSPLCAVFTDAEWMAYEYAWDMRYAHMVGPLNPLSPYLGFPWLHAQTRLFHSIDNGTLSSREDFDGFDMYGSPVLKNSNGATHSQMDQGDLTHWPAGQRFFLSFTHREVPPLIATALGIFNSSFEEKKLFPTDHVVWTRAWKMSDLIPFLGHVGVEKMTCIHPVVAVDSGAHLDHDNNKDQPVDFQSEEYIRVIANAAPRPIPRCQDGPGASCRFEEFSKIVNEGADEFRDWHSMCGMKDTC